MKPVFVALSLIMMTTQTYISPDPLTCTKDIKEVVDQLFLVAESFEIDYAKPDPVAMKKVLDTLQIFLFECPGVKVELSKYDRCIDYTMPIYPLIRDLAENAQHMPVIDIIVDSSEIALTLLHGISRCIKEA